MKMAPIDNLELIDISKDTAPCQLSGQADEAEPVFASGAAALTTLTDELNGLADRNRLELQAFVAAAHSSAKTNDDFDRARTLVRQIGILKQKLRSRK